MHYCVSDIHGDYAKYRAMLEAISFKSSDTLYVLGDVIDRGPDGVKILRDMMLRSNVVPILGNHELTAALCLPWLLKEVTEESLKDLDEVRISAFSEWVANGGESTLRGIKALPRTEREELLDYFQEMDLYAQVTVGERTYILTHAGLDHFAPDKPLEDYELEDFLFARPDPEAAYYPDKTLVFGHTPTRMLWQAVGEPPKDEIFRGTGFIDIDCGCDFGGRLGCLCLDSMEEMGRGSLCEFLSAREAFCRVFPKVRAKTHGEIDAILRKDEADIRSGKRDPEKEGVSVEEYKRRRQDAWKKLTE